MLIPLFLVHSWRTTTSLVSPTPSPMLFSHRTPLPLQSSRMVFRSSTKDKSSISAVVRVLQTVRLSGSPATTLSQLCTNGSSRSTLSGTTSSPSLPISSHTITLPCTTHRNCSSHARVTTVLKSSPSSPTWELAHRTNLSSSTAPTLHSSQTSTSSTWSAAPSTKPMPAVTSPSPSTTVSQLSYTLPSTFTARPSAVKMPPRRSPCRHQHQRTSLAPAQPLPLQHSTYLPLLLF